MTKGVTYEKEEEKQRHQEVDWLAYFKGIKALCPWSLRAYMSDKILHVLEPNNCELSFCAAFRNSKHEAVLFEYNNNTSVDTLLAVVGQIEAVYGDLIAFWSHPTEGDNNTPVPCVIVQDRAQLTDLRKQVGYTDE